MTLPVGLTLRRFNNFLSLIVIALAVYILIWPFWPNIVWYLGNSRVPVIQNLAKPNNPTPASSGASIPTANTLVVPRMNLETTIIEGRGNQVLESGVWRRPQTSTPDKGGNTVVVGHRFTYSSTGIFYHLDKLKIDDQIIVYWGGKQYNYKVVTSKVVPATALEVEAATKDKRLTLYTCTPLWSFKERLVVVAEIQEGEPS